MRKKMSGVENETDKKSKLRAIQDWTTERIGDVRYMVNRCITYENKRNFEHGGYL